jgi:ORMDL family
MKQQRQQSVPNGSKPSASSVANMTMNTAHLRSLHLPLPRSRNNSKEFTGSDKDAVMTLGNTSAFTDVVGNPSQTLLPESPSGRNRFNSRDFKQSYSYQFTTETNNVLPLERSHYFLGQNLSFVVFLSTYLTLIVILLLVSTSIVSTAANVPLPFTNPLSQYLNIFLSSSWSITNGLHCLITLLCLHWFKGSYLLDEQGELSGMTVWEQLEATSESKTYMRRTFITVPIGLAYIACLVNKYQPITCTINLIFLSIVMFAKLPQMLGVRILGINSTAGIDDEFVMDDAAKAPLVHRDPATTQLTIQALQTPPPTTLPYAKRD